MTKKRENNVSKVIRAWWSEKCAQIGEKITLNAQTQDAANHVLDFQIYEFRRKSKIVKEISVPVYHPEISAKWKVAYKSTIAEYGNPEFRFKAKIGNKSKTSKTLYIPATLEIALTFDDGPAPKEKPRTKRILDVLKSKRIKASFFVEHSNILDKYRQDLLKRMTKEGHNVGIHGVDSKKHHLRHQDTPDFEDKLRAMRNLIKEITGAYPIFIRPPYGWGGWEKGGIFNKSQLRRIYSKFNMIRVNGWESEVGKKDFWLAIERKIENAAKGNAQKLIILSHDLREYDAVNLPEIIKGIEGRVAKVKVKIKYLTLKEFYKK